MKSLHMITFILLVVGGLNWLLVGVLGWDVGNIFGGQDYSKPSGGQSFSTRSNIFGGQDYSNGGSSRKNIFGGQDYSFPKKR